VPGWIGPAELIPLILVVLLIFGPKRLPEMGGSFGAGLTRFLSGRGARGLEVGRLRRERRSGGKSDALDA